jgi:hypothetical protein
MGCGLRPAEVAALNVNLIQRREDHWVIVGLVGKTGRVRSVPMPSWVKDAIDAWTSASGIISGRLLRCVRKNGDVWGSGLSQNVVWHVVKECAKRTGILKLARTSCVAVARDFAIPQEAHWPLWRHAATRSQLLPLEICDQESKIVVSAQLFDHLRACSNPLFFRNDWWRRV